MMVPRETIRSKDEAEKEMVRVVDLKKHFHYSSGPIWRRKSRVVKAVDGVSFALSKNQSMGLVGESGCGKTTLGMMLMGLEKPSSGDILIHGKALGTMEPQELKNLRKKMQIVFQDPFASLDPMWNVSQIIGEPFAIHRALSQKECSERIAELLDLVGLDSGYSSRYPHEMSGGQRQRIAIARALAFDPEFIIADEPTSALDVSVKAQIINLLEELRDRVSLSMIFISHDLSVVYHICDYIQVMYRGKIVEKGPTEILFKNPLHPYTRMLLDSIPLADPRKRRERRLSFREQVGISEKLLGPQYAIDPDRMENLDEVDALHEVEAGHFVRCCRR